MNEPPLPGDALAPATERPAVVFVSDASAEADRLSASLASRGYEVVDVPLALLVARVAVQRPALILLDVDAPGALEVARAVRGVPGTGDLDLLLVGEIGRTLHDPSEALQHDASGFFSRPVDLATLVRKIEALIGPAARRASAPPPSRRASRSLLPGAARAPQSMAWVPPAPPPPRIAVQPSSPPSASAVAPRAPLASVGPLPGSRAPGASLSPEVEQILRHAEERIASLGPAVAMSFAPSPEEEVEAVLPAELLATLDEPLDGSDDGEGSFAGQTVAAAPALTSATPRDATVPGDGTAATSLHGDALGAPADRVTVAPPATMHERLPAGLRARPTGAPPAPAPPSRPTAPPAQVEPPARDADSAPLTRAAQRAASTTPPHPATLAAPVPTGPRVATASPLAGAPIAGSPAHALAQAIGERATGALCVEDAAGIRRIVLRDGDVVTAASGIDDESLLGFLSGRGDVPRDVATRLGGRIPAFGRHAGAALIAHGHLGQDDLWPVLRAHAEWVLGAALAAETATSSFDSEPPGRLKAEPSVFGGSTAAEVFVDVEQRIVPPATALARLGGARARLARGPRSDLLGECALGDAEIVSFVQGGGGTVEELLAVAPEAASIAWALVELGVLQAVEPVAAHASQPPQPDLLDEVAVRAKVRARLALVEEGDYFALLGVPRHATGYDVRRAYLDLRRAFEPHRTLGPGTEDLAEDVRLVLEVLDEAHDVLRDTHRRERYRRAIDAPPPS